MIYKLTRWLFENRMAVRTTSELKVLSDLFNNPCKIPFKDDFHFPIFCKIAKSCKTIFFAALWSDVTLALYLTNFGHYLSFTCSTQMHFRFLQNNNFREKLPSFHASSSEDIYKQLHWRKTDKRKTEKYLFLSPYICRCV